MKKILITGSLGQIGSELTTHMRHLYGTDCVIATDIRRPEHSSIVENGPFEILDVLDYARLKEIAVRYEVDTIVHLAALLSAVAESKPQFAWNLNMGGLVAALEVARELNLQLFTPSSIGSFGPNTPSADTPQDVIQRPTTIYGITKVAGELLCDYYYQKFGVDTRGIRFPGLISNQTKPGGGTTDYAVEIYYEAVTNKAYTSFLGSGTYLDMMYMPDAINAIVQLMEANPEKLIHRNAFNLSAMSVSPEQIASSIRRHIPGFKMNYNVDPIRQAIADSWPDSIDYSAAREEWGFNPHYNLDKMTMDMLQKLTVRLESKQKKI